VTAKIKINQTASFIDKSKILIVDDHRNIRLSLRTILEHEGASVFEAENLKSAFVALKFTNKPEQFKMVYDLVLLDLRLPDGSGIDLLKKLNALQQAARVIIISGEGTTAEAFQATQMGAFDYIEKPFSPERILVSVGRALEFSKVSEDLGKSNRPQEMLGQHPSLKEVQDLIERVAPTSGRVLITGESGTGKELVAKAIHRASTRSNKPMIKVNCAAIPHGLMESELFGHEKGAFTGAVKQRQGVFERANEGTLFLDEIAELNIDLQAKLLRILQTGEFTRVGGEKVLSCDIRIIAATNKDLKAHITDGLFREDLFYRLNVVSIHMPPLRDRISDIPVLANSFLRDACSEHSLGEKTFAENALKDLQSYSWPGNIRELKNLIERVAILAEDPVIDSIEEMDHLRTLTSSVNHQPAISLAEIESSSEDLQLNLSLNVMTWETYHETADREFLRFVLKTAKGNVSEAARLLALERAYLHRLLKKLGIQRDVSFS
jgi:two-component system nitrogen regulation response regulator NtrX